MQRFKAEGSALLNLRCCQGQVNFAQSSRSAFNAEKVAQRLSELVPNEGVKYGVSQEHSALLDWAANEAHHAYEVNLKGNGLTTRTNHNLITQEAFVSLTRHAERALVFMAQLLIAEM